MLAALDAGIDVIALRRRHPVLSTEYRSETRNYMRTTHEGPDGRVVAIKGSPVEVAPLCTHRRRANRVVPLTDAERAAVDVENQRMAGQGLRVLAIARADAPDGPTTGGWCCGWASSASPTLPGPA